MGAFLLFPALWMLGICAYGRGHVLLFVAAGIVLIVLVLLSGAAAWVLGKAVLASEDAPSSRVSRIRTGRLCGLIGAAIAAAYLLFIVGLLVRAHGVAEPSV